MQCDTTITPSTLSLSGQSTISMPPPAAFVPREPDGLGVGKPAHPFAATVEAQVPVSSSSPSSDALLMIECNRPRWVWNQVSCLSYYHRRCFVRLPHNSSIQLMSSLPTGTQLPGGAVLPMSSVADFPMVLPEGKCLFALVSIS
jgi:hypothetical protein